MGGIYSDESCPLCKSCYRDTGRFLACPSHPKQKASSLFRVQFRGMRRRCRTYEEAQRILTGWRYKTDEGTWDARDYTASRPLALSTLSRQWLAVKESQVAKNTLQKVQNHLFQLQTFTKDISVKALGYAEIEQFLVSLRALSSKSRHDVLSTIKQFLKWAEKAHKVPQPDYPSVRYELAWRPVVDKDTQSAILKEVCRIAPTPRVSMAIRWLATYINMRPGELLKIQEKHVDYKAGEILIPHPKERKAKTVYLLPEDLEELKTLSRGFPEMFLFRHDKSRKGGVRAGQPFGKRLLYEVWKDACANMGIEGVDLYGGTRHSSARALRQDFSLETIRHASGHTTNKAFERYIQDDSASRLVVSKAARGGTKVGQLLRGNKKAETV